MEVQVGPVSSASVFAWVAYAREVLARVSAGGDAEAPAVGLDAVASFERYLTTWAELAAHSPQFVWADDVDPEEVEYLAHVWFVLAGQLPAADPTGAAARRGLPRRPPESEEFFQSLVTAMLDALSREGRSLQAFAEQLREEWPGLRDP